MSKTLEWTLRLVLWILFMAAAAHALFVGWVGLTYGLSLWDLSNPSPTLHWLAALAFPITLFLLLSRRPTGLKHVAMVFAGALAFVAYWVLFHLGGGHILDCGLRWSCS